MTSLHLSDHEGAVVWVILLKKKVKKRTKGEYDEGMEVEKEQ